MPAIALPSQYIDRQSVRGFGEEVQILNEKLHQFSFESSVAISRQPISLRFLTLAATWKANTLLSSSMRDIVADSSYLQIIGMGQKVIPFILKDLESAPAHWFLALRSITGTDPVTRDAIGDVKKMRECWLSWGKENGYV